MNNLIDITAVIIGKEEVNAVNSRELWKFLESKQKFADWIKNRIRDYGFEDGLDFFINLGKSHGRPSKEYIISLDMAKELAMVENNSQGRKIRRYFIEAEKQFRRKVHALPNETCEGDLFADHITFRGVPVVPSYLLARFVRISNPLLGKLSRCADFPLVNGKDIFRLKNVSDRFLESAKEAGIYVSEEYRNINLFTPSGAEKVINVMRELFPEDDEPLLERH